MPLDGYLLKITRKDTHTWQTDEVLEVSFSNLVVPEKCSFKTVKFRKFGNILNILNKHFKSFVIFSFS